MRNTARNFRQSITISKVNIAILVKVVDGREKPFGKKKARGYVKKIYSNSICWISANVKAAYKVEKNYVDTLGIVDISIGYMAIVDLRKFPFNKRICFLTNPRSAKGGCENPEYEGNVFSRSADEQLVSKRLRTGEK